MEEIMRTKQLRDWQTIEEFTREQVEEERQADHNTQE
jgi:hypothetical protein